MEINRIEKTRLQLIRKGHKIINLSSGNPGEFGITFPPKILQLALKQFLKNPQYQPDPKGSLKARQAIAKFYLKRDLKLLPDQILLTSGSSESYLHLFKLLARPGDEILSPNPSYPLFEEIANLAEIKLSFYKLAEKNNWQIDLDDLVSKITARTKAIILISPSNPTGAVLTVTTLNKVLKLAEKFHLSVICDEVFSEFIFDQKKFPRLAQIATPASRINIFTISGISKTYALPGLKLSWIIVTGPQSKMYIDKLEHTIDALLATNQISQNMLPTIMKKGENFIKFFRQKIETNRNLAIKILSKNPRITFYKPAGGFYLFAKINQPANNHTSGQNAHFSHILTDEQFVIDFMQKNKIFVHPGYFYDYNNGIYILISLLPPESILKNSLRKICN